MHSLAVVIPCYNVEKYLRTAVESVLSQDYPVDEIILVDNNSSDGTFELMNELSALSTNIRILKQPTPGASAARNLGWKQARCEYIHFLDADDYLMPNSLAKKMEVLLSRNSDFLVNGHVRLNERGESFDFAADEDLFRGLFNGKIGGSSSNIIRKSLLEEVGGWDETLASSQEITLYFEILKKSPKVVIVPESLSIVIDREGQISKSNPGPRWERLLNLRHHILVWLEEKQPEYWKLNREYFLQSMFDWLHIAYPYCSKKCEEYYRSWIIQRHYRPTHSAAVSKSFLILLRIFGFQKAERIKEWIKK